MDPACFEGGGTASASLEKYIFNYRYIERLETDSVAGDRVMEKRRLNPDGDSARETGSKKEMTWGNQSFRKLIRFLYFWYLLIYLLLHIGMNTESRGGQQS